MPRSTYYYQPRPESAENLRLLRELDELYLDVRSSAAAWPSRWESNRKRIQPLMRILGMEAQHPKPHLSRPPPGYEI